MNTEELVEKCVKRNKHAWNEFVRQYESLVRRAVLYKLNRMNSRSLKSEADDIVQEVFLVLWKDNKLTSLKDLSCLKSWLVLVTINKTLTYCKRRWKDQQKTRSLNQGLAEDGFTLEDVIPSGAFDPREALEVKEMAEHAKKEMSYLKRKERRVLELSLIEGKKQIDIAEIMDMPTGTVASLIRRAKKQVREGIKEYCLS